MKLKLIHTLLFLLRPEKKLEDIKLAEKNLKSLEKSSFRTLVVYNQGSLSNGELEDFLRQFDLECIVIGSAVNVGINVSRQQCFQYIWDNYPDTEFISELHMDMIFTHHWEDAILDFLSNNDEPMMSVGIVNKRGELPYLEDTKYVIPSSLEEYDSFLSGLCRDKIVHGFTHPCIHKAKILKEIGGYDARFLNGKQSFEDDSLLLGYFYYYGTKKNWYPKINYNSVVYHAIALQRLDLQRYDLHDNFSINLNGLIKQYGAMGLKNLIHLRNSAWHKDFFQSKINEMLK
ncbi:hypothetical protein [Lacrimispora sp.]|uniref:hypothetical protein n=1 Tax=Lacrimispora sp. TaxID=2719234 RepID=UPI003217390C